MGEDDGMGRADWLDWLHSLACGAALFAILYQYSSLGRMLVVMVTVLLLYLHHAAIFPFRRAAPANVPANPRHQIAAGAADNRNDVVARPAPAGAAADDAAGGPADRARETPAAVDGGGDAALPPPPPPPPPAGAHGWTRAISVSVCSFFFSFFASLLPEGPQQDGRN
ncbi:homocysteine-responsive endoplasmic reticulum-resident ubiquitin-like domain member 1 protein [Lethenteron reissneri]|uniref:homocysteine-responsive endoplasmic reticulum-resident ubiquitin-like domain member 1 protein n=1 Tax=Lethenteron reissneri TaxID=7753 RepID=UPI002AB61C04|nr:homocysteine-responsive endoplasmic reticulum-resident ubiquitin-like domain member 1 protein [Lethenteron reissneri]